MSLIKTLSQKVQNKERLIRLLAAKKLIGNKIVFTNGCFDLLHPGHLRYLAQARDLGDFLIVGLNSDESVGRLKGSGRPIQGQDIRAEMLAALHVVDAVVVFAEDTPFELISFLKPDILVKGGDYTPATTVGADVVMKYGGDVQMIPFEKGFSTTDLIAKIKHGQG
jgi:rfaE bifunctional protein nucleotidyltransferase chain/domain